MEYENKSKAVHEALRGFISEAQQSMRASGEMLGMVLALAYLDKQGLVEDITSFLHGAKKGDYVREVGEIKAMVQGLMALKGVKQAASSIIAP
jgi:metal-responsive CopG/Arc/MetJ family transcriptional regulator